MANISVAIANTFLQNATIVSPQGTSTFEQTGTYDLDDPQYDSAGALVGTTTRSIPTFTQTITLSTTGQDIYNAEQGMKLALNTIGQAQSEAATTALSTPFSLASLPDRATAPSAPTLVSTLTALRSFQQTVGEVDTSADRDTVTAAVVSRLEYQSTIARNARIVQLANMGILAGSEAYENEMQVFDFQVTDGRLQAIRAGAEEQTRLFNIELQKGRFFNEVIGEELRTETLYVDFSNRTSVNRFQTLMAVADFVNTYRERVLQETITERTQPLNEISTMIRGGSVPIPAYTGFKGGNISDTPFASSVYNSANLAQQSYQSRIAQQNAMLGGIAQLGGAVLSAPMPGGGSVAGNMLSSFR